jgi:hypothetical protein
VALIDERKALRLAATRFPAVPTATTVDVLFCPAVVSRLGTSAVADAVFHALEGAHMRVQVQHLDVIVQLIGRERARQCPSLPRVVRGGTQDRLAHEQPPG